MSDKPDSPSSKGPLGVPPVELSRGNGSVDPTRNVLDLVQAAVQRMDDLRNAENRRIDDLRTADNRRIDDIMGLRADYDTKLQLAESKRIDAIRAVDVQAVATATDRANAAAGVLAANVQVSAETQRQLVADSASALAEQLQTIIRPIMESIAGLQKAQYEGQGKAVATDPVMAQLAQDMREVTHALALGSGSTQGTTQFRNEQRASTGLVIGLVGIAVTVVIAALTITGFIIARSGG